MNRASAIPIVDLDRMYGLPFANYGQDTYVSLKDIKNDLISEAELLVYQMRAAHLETDYEAINEKAEFLTGVCKKLEMVKDEEERLQKELGL